VNKVVKIRWVGSVTLTLMVACIAACNGPPDSATELSSSPDLSTHPLYATYRFGADETTIDIGTQPLYWPPVLFTEAIRRDKVLSEILAEKGIKLRLHPFLSGADVNFFLARGDLDMAIGGDMPALTAAANLNVHIVGMIQQGFTSLVTRKHLLIEELRGKRVAYTPGSNAHYALLRTLASADIGSSEVHMIPLEVAQMAEALDKGEIDAFSAWEPIPVLARKRFPRFVVAHRSLSTSYLYFSRIFAQRHPEVEGHLIASMQRALTWIKSSRENLFKACDWALAESNRFAGKQTLLTADDCHDLALNDLLRSTSMIGIPPDDLLPDGRLARELALLKTQGRIPAAVKWDTVRTCFDISPVKITAVKAQGFRPGAYTDKKAAKLD
jgi:sulfonate transport system substrate-binding protein